MTPKQEAALRLAREALQYIYEGANNQGPHTGISWRCASNKVEPAIAAIDEALAEQPANVAAVNTSSERVAKQAQNVHEQPAQQQEPVGYTSQSWLAQSTGGQFSKRKGICGDVPLYTSPQPSKPWVGLTEEEVDECYYWKGRQWTTDELVRHVEAKLKEKNA